MKACKKTGIIPELYHFDESLSQEKLIKFIETLNKKPTLDSILVQLPLPEHIQKLQVINSIEK